MGQELGLGWHRELECGPLDQVRELERLAIDQAIDLGRVDPDADPLFVRDSLAEVVAIFSVRQRPPQHGKDGFITRPVKIVRVCTNDFVH